MKQNFKQIVAQGYKAFITTEVMATKNNKLECLEVVVNIHENADLLGKVKDVSPSGST
ncbi:MAG: hypothetical protein SPJ16_09490 [Helicobacter sp.]|uniref:hypothetical protein n=1 Tax=Helicobacter sp. TaxID=218 RepID=UPI002A91CE1A|nr:hypothetical protein [Helicobacter sp.]MDY5951408.1 hypothetical protein [Helicobacter sp.]